MRMNKLNYKLNKLNHYIISCIFENVLTRGKNMDRPKMNRFLEELRFIYCNVDKPNEELD